LNEHSPYTSSHDTQVRFVTLGSHNHTDATCANAVRDALLLAKGPFTDRRKAKAAIQATAELVAGYKGATHPDTKKVKMALNAMR